MSIETEFQSTIENVQNAYKGLANLGATIPQNKNIENISDCLDEIYGVLPKTEFQEGTSVTIEGGLKGKLDFEDGIVGIGDTSQKSYSGKNLYPSGTSTQTISGITFTPQIDGGIKLQGTSTYSNYYVAGGESNYVDVPNLSNLAEAITLSVSGMQEGIQVYVVGQTLGAKGTSVSGSIGFTTIANDKYRLFIRVMANSTVDTTLYIQLEKGSSATSFEQYTGGTASPNPSYPQEVEVVRGKNLLDSELEKGTYNDNTGEQIATDGNYRNVSPIKVCPNTTYTFSINGVKQKYCVYYYDSSNNFISWIPAETGTFTTPNNCYYINFRCYVADYTSDFANLKLQLEKGSQATSYLPYNTLEVVERGKNEADPNNIILGKSLGTSGELTPMTARATLFENSIKPNTQYHLSIDNNYQIGNLFYYNKDKTYLTVQGSAWGNNKTTTTPSNAYYISFATKKIDDTTMTESDIEKLQIQIEEGSSATDYEPYITPTSYQLSLGDIQLNAIGNYKDELVYDVDEDRVYKNKNILKISIKDSTNVTYQTTFDNNSRFTYLTRPSLDIINATSKGFAYCNRLTLENGYSLDTVHFYAWSTVVYFFLPNNIANSLETFATWVANNNLEFYIPLNNTVKEEITGTLSDQVKALYNAHSNNGTTIIKSNGDLPMIIKVRGLKGA